MLQRPNSAAVPTVPPRAGRRARTPQQVTELLEYLHPDEAALEAASRYAPCEHGPLKSWSAQGLRQLEIAAEREIYRREQARHDAQTQELERCTAEERAKRYAAMLR